MRKRKLAEQRNRSRKKKTASKVWKNERERQRDRETGIVKKTNDLGYVLLPCVCSSRADSLSVFYLVLLSVVQKPTKRSKPEPASGREKAAKVKAESSSSRRKRAKIDPELEDKKQLKSMNETQHLDRVCCRFCFPVCCCVWHCRVLGRTQRSPLICGQSCDTRLCARTAGGTLRS